MLRLEQQLSALKDARQALDTERHRSLPASGEEGDSAGARAVELGHRIAELAAQLKARRDRAAAAAKASSSEPASISASAAGASDSGQRESASGTTAPKEDADSTPQLLQQGGLAGKPVDPLALGQVRYRTGDYAGALDAYRAVELDRLTAEERCLVQYMAATCFRKTGKADEAAVWYREVANAKVEDPLVEVARWQLALLDWRQELEAKLADLRQRSKDSQP